MTEDSKLHNPPIKDLKDDKQMINNDHLTTDIKYKNNIELDNLIQPVDELCLSDQVTNVNNSIEINLNNLNTKLTNESKDLIIKNETPINANLNDKLDESDMNKQDNLEESINFRRGKCKWFNNLKGWGFITPLDGSEDVFVHQSVINMSGFRSLIVDQEVDFKAKLTKRGPEAVMVAGVEKTNSIKKPKTKSTRKIRCFNCGEFTTHLASECDQSPQPKKCHHCKSDDHLIADCPLRVAYLLLEEAENTTKNNEKKELTDNDFIKDNKIQIKDELTNIPPSIEQIKKQNCKNLDNKTHNNVLIDKENFLTNNKVKDLISYKKLTKKKKKQTSTSSLSNTSFSSSELSSSNPSQSTSPCSFTYSNYTNQPQSNEINYYNNFKESQESYLINNQFINDQINNRTVNNLVNNQQFLQSNYLQESNSSFPYYEQQQFYLPINYNNNYRLNQSNYNSINQIHQPINSNYLNSTQNLSTNHLNNSMFKVYSPPYEFNNEHSTINSTSPILHNNQDQINDQFNYLNNYQNNQYLQPFSSQTSLPNKLIYSNQFNCYNNLNNSNLAYLNPINNCNCCNSNQKLRQYNCLPNQVCDEIKYNLNHTCSSISNCCSNNQQCINHFQNNCHNSCNFNCNQIINHNCCNIKSNHCNHLNCKINICDNHHSCLNSHCKSIHKLTCQLKQTENCCCNQFLKSNLITNQLNKQTNCQLQNVSIKKAFKDQFETDSGLENSRCSTATGNLEI